MSTWQRCAYESHKGTASSKRWRHVTRAFTLIELLVVIAIISMLISILLPSLSGAREQARMAVCGQKMREFANGLSTYLAEYNDYVPGVNTSGVAVRALSNMVGSQPGLLYKGNMPVQSFDWMTPILSPSMELPASRAERFKFLFEEYGCPSQRYTSIIYYDSSGPDIPDHEDIAPYTGASYLMPSFMQYWSATPPGSGNGRVVGHRKFRMAMGRTAIYAEVKDNWEVVQQNYESRLTQVGSPSRKIFCADGTRYVDASKILDHDVSLFPSSFGAFTTAGAWWSGSTAYGVKQGTPTWGTHNATQGSPSEGENLAVSYRHGRQTGVQSGNCKDNKGAINACFFDGHVERMTDQESREIHLWYPSGGKVEHAAEGMTDVPAEFFVP